MTAGLSLSGELLEHIRCDSRRAPRLVTLSSGNGVHALPRTGKRTMAGTRRKGMSTVLPSIVR